MIYKLYHNITYTYIYIYVYIVSWFYMYIRISRKQWTVLCMYIYTYINCLYSKLINLHGNLAILSGSYILYQNSMYVCMYTYLHTILLLRKSYDIVRTYTYARHIRITCMLHKLPTVCIPLYCEIQNVRHG